MSLDIRALAREAFRTAKSIAPQAFELVTIRVSPSTSVDFVTDTESTTWETEEEGVSVLRYDHESEREDLPLEMEFKNFLVDIQDLPDDLNTDTSQNGEIEDADGVAWEVYNSQIDPSRSVLIFMTRRGKTASS